MATTIQPTETHTLVSNITKVLKSKKVKRFRFLQDPAQFKCYLDFFVPEHMSSVVNILLTLNEDTGDVKLYKEDHQFEYYCNIDEQTDKIGYSCRITLNYESHT